MNILITGGNGFVASHLKNFLGDQHTVYAPGKDQLNCLEIQEVSSFFDKHDIDVVIHTALTGREQLFENSTKLFREGLDMWNNIYSFRHRYKKLIQYGSAYEVNLSQDNNLIDLSYVLNSLPMSSYGSVKNQMARICDRTDNFYTLRLFGHFHHTEADHRFFKKLYTSDNFSINEDRFFDYFNLDDTLTVTKFVIDESPSVRDINLVYPEKLLISEQVQMFCDINNIQPKIEIKSSGFNLTGNSETISSFGLHLSGLTNGFKKYK